MAESFSETITPHEGTAPLNGRVIGALETDNGYTYYKLRVPGNGLWWIEGDALNREEGRYQDYWIRAREKSAGFRLLDWVRAQPILQGQFCPYPRNEDMQATIDAYGSKDPLLHYDYEIKLIEPTAIDFYLEEAPASQEPLAERGSLMHPWLENPTTLQLRIANHRELDELLVRWRDDLWLGWGAFNRDLDFDPSAQEWSLYAKPVMYICSCEEWLCGSILAWVEKDEVHNRVIWREVERLTGGGYFQLGPSLYFDADAYHMAHERFREQQQK